jgi:Escherichia/Staphylococcus phage prohead protease
MLHKTVATTPRTTDQGEFTAIAATYQTDREGERILPGAFASTIANWQASGKRLPLHWNHGSAAADVIGYVDPASMRETDEGLLVRGQLDLEDSAVAREAWRSMKNDAIGLSFGYLVTAERTAGDGTRELVALDLFEISLTPSPVNAETRIVSMKSLSEVDPALKAYHRDVMLKVLRYDGAEELANLSHGELKAYSDELVNDLGVDLRPPPRIVSFDC